MITFSVVHSSSQKPSTSEQSEGSSGWEALRSLIEFMISLLKDGLSPLSLDSTSLMIPDNLLGFWLFVMKLNGPNLRDVQVVEHSKIMSTVLIVTALEHWLMKRWKSADILF